MVLIEPGGFTMGSPEAEQWHVVDEVQHQVKISAPFYLGRYEVTQSQWKKVMGTSPSEFIDCGPQCPAEMISWPMAIEFCNKLSQIEGLSPCYSGEGNDVVWDRACTGYRLPTEAEWEYAARAGSGCAFIVGDETTDLAKVAHYRSADRTPLAVGSKQPNAWGLYDMLGNVREWVWDWYAPYDKQTASDPAGPEKGKFRVNRGGCYFSYPQYCRCAVRGAYLPGDTHGYIGLRVARNAPSQAD